MSGEQTINGTESKSFYKVLIKVYKAVAKSTSLKEALTILVDMTASLIHCERGTIFINNKKTEELYSYVSYGGLDREIRLLNTRGLAGWSFTHDEALSILDAYQDTRFENNFDEMTGFKTKNVLCVPLKSSKNELIGVTQMLNKIDGDFTQNDIKIVKAMTEQAALAIQSKLFIEEMEAAHKKELDFLEAITSVSSEIKISALLDKIISTITKMLEAERSTLFINDEKTNQLYTEASEGLDKVEIRFPNHLGIAGTVFTSGSVINIPHAYADLRFNPAFDKKTGFFTRSILTAPVKNKAGKIIGVTQVLNKKQGEFNQADISQLLAINAQISMAIENAKLFDDVQSIKNYNESILEGMTNGVITINAENKIVTCNKSGLRIFNLQNMTDIINKDIALFFEGKNQWLYEKLTAINHSSTGGLSENIMDVELYFSDTKISSNITLLPLFDNKNKQLGSMIMIDDISSEKRMKSTMSRYMSAELADKLMQSTEFSMGGASSNATILFSDLRNFTTLSESLGPEGTVKLLNEYFSLMVDCIHNEGGILDKFIGDAMMAVFGIPLIHEDDPDRALRSAIAMMKALRGFNEKRSTEKLMTIDHGMGINTDIIVSGNIGSEKRMDFTVIGDGVNLASRIESLCKQYGAHVLISEFTFKKLKSTYRTRMLDKVIVKGKSQPVAIYEVIDFHDEHTFPNQIEVLSHFNDGMEYYLQTKWDKAITCFESALKGNANDKPSTLYIERCQTLKATPPSGDWNGVWVFTHK